ncbi:hypothetical protein E6W39_03620 [Kitasatospora acidiphila]|uniref:Uncharacterized protein n=1 Tax=Kitasatospora acidiphila TaxID=2567942 RepID=A0A540VXL0_9ACTN|nr:hypothetical protein [Kitasatospora acidiphila]TQF01499.1 hypothetical protein E6W39_03620 [Kitasatospora acidiphila]
MATKQARALDAVVAAGRARFRTLPERVRFEDMTEMKDVSASGGPDMYDPERQWAFYSCLALDLGL